jgi:hypothetical protein
MPPDLATPPEPNEEEIPPLLREDLVQLFNRAPAIASDVDASILSSARSAYERRMKFRPFVRRVVVVGSIAAGLVITFTLVSVLHHAPPRLAQIGDVNRDGRVDILDALVVARALADGGKLDASWDMNHDGVVDQKDVDWIAATAVNVSGAGGQQ